MASDVTELKEQIRREFVAGSPPAIVASGNSGVGYDQVERARVQDCFGGKDWAAVDVSELDHPQSSALYYLTYEAFFYYLPALMIGVLEGLEILLSMLGKFELAVKEDKVPQLTLFQTEVVLDWLAWTESSRSELDCGYSSALAEASLAERVAKHLRARA